MVISLWELLEHELEAADYRIFSALLWCHVLRLSGYVRVNASKICTM